MYLMPLTFEKGEICVYIYTYTYTYILYMNFVFYVLTQFYENKHRNVKPENNENATYWECLGIWWKLQE